MNVWPSWPPANVPKTPLWPAGRPMACHAKPEKNATDAHYTVRLNPATNRPRTADSLVESGTWTKITRFIFLINNLLTYQVTREVIHPAELLNYSGRRGVHPTVLLKSWDHCGTIRCIQTLCRQEPEKECAGIFPCTACHASSIFCSFEKWNVWTRVKYRFKCSFDFCSTDVCDCDEFAISEKFCGPTTNNPGFDNGSTVDAEWISSALLCDERNSITAPYLLRAGIPIIRNACQNISSIFDW